MDLEGPVTRSLDAGASGYLIAGSLGELAAMLVEEQHPVAPRHEPRALPTRSVDEEILTALADLASRRATAGRARPEPEATCE